MDPKEFTVINDIFTRYHVIGHVLEIGATPDDTALLNMPSLHDACLKVGLDLGGPAKFNDFRIIRGNGNNMQMFADEAFDCVLCASVFEHDKYFWKTVSEIKRVTKPGGVIAMSAPGYGDSLLFKLLVRIKGLQIGRNQTRSLWLFSSARRSGFKGTISRFVLCLYGIAASAPTLAIHNWPGDYYRFSVQAFREVLLEGLENIEIYQILNPPRIIGCGVKPLVIEKN
jgi:SAM-dependent methyltransferase